MVVVSSSGGEVEEKYVLGKAYFEDLLNQMESLTDTLEIMADRRLLNQITSASDTLDEDLRRGPPLSGPDAPFRG